MRRSGSFIDAFQEHIEGKGAPANFARWSAICTVSAAMERKVWVTNKWGTLYPNLYVVLVGPPAGGKSQALTAVSELFREQLPGHFLAAGNVSRAGLVDGLKDSEKTVMIPGEAPPTLTYNALFVVADEFSMFMPEYDSDFLSAMNQLYIGKAYSERKRTKDINFEVPHPLLTMIAGAQPAFLQRMLPDSAWNEGFTSRCVMVYSPEPRREALFNISHDHSTNTSLGKDLKAIAKLAGHMSVSADTGHMWNDWYVTQDDPGPRHPKLVYYCHRRPATHIKLMMIASAARSDDMRILPDDFNTALEWLHAADEQMEEIFKAMKSGGDSNAIEECHYAVVDQYIKTGRKPVPTSLVVGFLAERVPSANVMRVLETMEKGGWLKKGMEKGIGEVYVPNLKKVST